MAVCVAGPVFVGVCVIVLVAVAVLVAVEVGGTEVSVAVGLGVAVELGFGVAVAVEPAGGAPTPKAPVLRRARPAPVIRNPEAKKRLMGLKFTSI